MTLEGIKITRELLNRVDIKGAEVQAFVLVSNELTEEERKLDEAKEMIEKVHEVGPGEENPKKNKLKH